MSAAGESWFCRTAAGVCEHRPEQRLTELLDGVEGAHPEQVLLQGPDEALGAAVPLGSPHKGGRALDAEEGKLLAGRRALETERLKAKLGEMLLERELLDAKIAALEANRPFGPPEVATMSRTHSPSSGRPYGLARVCRVWRASRATSLPPSSRPEPPAAASGPR